MVRREVVLEVEVDLSHRDPEVLLRSILEHERIRAVQDGLTRYDLGAIAPWPVRKSLD